MKIKQNKFYFPSLFVRQKLNSLKCFRCNNNIKYQAIDNFTKIEFSCCTTKSYKLPTGQHSADSLRSVYKRISQEMGLHYYIEMEVEPVYKLIEKSAKGQSWTETVELTNDELSVYYPFQE